MADSSKTNISNAKVPVTENLEWIHLNEIVSSRDTQLEGVREKLIRKTKENPFVPFGVLATTVALSYGLWNMKTGNKKKSQVMMRWRIGAQAFTISAIILGIAFGTSKIKS
ncbi:hypothetical protein CHUAL_011186 [Chamberlinius hualienensis]